MGKIIDAQGKPVANAAAVCMVPPGDPLSSDGAGMIHLSEPCQQLYCEGPTSLPGEVFLAADPTLTCRIKPGVLVRGRLTENFPSGTSFFYLRLIRTGQKPVIESIHDVQTGIPPAFSFRPQPPGRFRLEISDLENRWVCRADLGPLTPQDLSVTVPYRVPKVIKGKVLSNDKNSVVGLPIQIFSGFPVFNPFPSHRLPPETYVWRCGFDPVPAVMTDSDGKFSIAVDPGLPFLVVAGNLETPQGLAVASFETPPTEGITMKLTQLSRIRGQLAYKDNGASVPCSAQLLLLDGDAAWLAHALKVPTTASCSADGILSLGPFLPAPFELTIQPRSGMFELIKGDPPAPGEWRDLGRLLVTRGTGVEVAVVGPGDVPVAGAKVKGYGRAGMILGDDAETGNDGRAVLGGFPENAEITVMVDARGFQSGSVVRAATDDRPIRVVLKPAATLIGTVVDPQGEAVGGADVHAQMGKPGIVPTQTESDGSFKLDGLDLGEVRLSAAAPGFAASDPLTLVVNELREYRGQRLVLKPARGLKGTVTDILGKPVPGADVRCIGRYEKYSIDGIPARGRALTNLLGEFQLPGVDPTGAEILVVRAHGFAPSVVDGLPAKAGEPLAVTLGPSARLLVHIPGGAEADEQGAGVEDGLGITQHARLTPGTRQVVFDDLASGGGSARLNGGPKSSVQLEAGRTSEVTLKRGGTVRVLVTAQGQPVPRAIVQLLDRSNPNKPDSVGPALFTDTLGRAEFHGLPTGRLVAAAKSSSGSAEREIQVVGEEEKQIELPLIHALLRVNVTDEKTGAPVENAIVLLMPERFDAQELRGQATQFFPLPFNPGMERAVWNLPGLRDQADSAGTVHLSPPEIGAHKIWVQAENYQSWEGKVDVQAGESTLPVKLVPKPRSTLVIKIDGPPPTSPGELICQCPKSADVDFFFGTGRCKGLNSGPCRVLARVFGFGTARGSYELSSEAETAVTLTMLRGGELIVPVDGERTPRPEVRDAAGNEWGALLARVAGSDRNHAPYSAQLPACGWAWTFQDLPPGHYTVSVGGVPRAPIDVVAGRTVLAR